MSLRPPLVDPCTDPANAGTDYCKLRRAMPDGYPETPAEFNARRAAELEQRDGLLINITRGQNAPVLWLGLAALGVFLIASGVVRDWQD